MKLTLLVEVFESLRPEALHRLGEVYAPEAFFKDPFNEVTGLPAIRRIFEHMFETLHEPRFRVLNTLSDGGQAMVEWEFLFRIRRFRPQQSWCIRGVSHLRFEADGRVCYHRDFWDTGEELYQHLPAVGPVVRWLRRRMA